MHQLIFFGSDQYSEIALQELIKSDKCKIVAIVSTNETTVISNYARSSNIPLYLYPSKSAEEIKLQTFLDSLTLHDSCTGITASFPRLIHPRVIEKFNGNLYNIHPSLLPQYRNVAPVPYALALGDEITGVSIFRIANGIDNGEIVAQSTTSVAKSDTTPSLLHKLIRQGSELFTTYLDNPTDPSLTKNIPIYKKEELIFTRKLTNDSGFIEWDHVMSLISRDTLASSRTANPLITLRLTHHPDRKSGILSDLIRALEGYEKVWTLATTQKGELRISLSENPTGSGKYYVLIPGKPKAIPWLDFVKYYL